MEALEPLIRSLHAATARSGRRLVLACAGGGFGGASALLGVPGASSTVLEARSPYSRAAFLDYAGAAPPAAGFGSGEAALSLGRASLRRCRALLAAGGGGEGAWRAAAGAACGVGVAAALAREPPLQGEHRCHIALCVDDGGGLAAGGGSGGGGGGVEALWSLRLAKGARSRAQEEALCATAVVGAAAAAGGVLAPGSGALTEGAAAAAMEALLRGAGWGEAGDALEVALRRPRPPLQRLLHAGGGGAGGGGGGEEAVTHALLVGPAPAAALPNFPLAAAAAAEGRPLVVLPGSFNPLHDGHVALAAAALAVVAARGGAAGGGGAGATPARAPPLLVYELSVLNVDKPPLSEAEVERRAAQFFPPPPPLLGGGSGGGGGGGGGSLLLLSSHPRFLEKAALLPGASWVVGWDTAARLLCPRYYEGGEAGMVAALAALLAGGTRFIVGGRLASAAPLPEGWEHLRGAAGAGAFLTLNAHLLPRAPPLLCPLFEELPEAAFRRDLSSREIRRAQEAREGPARAAES